MPTSGTNGPPQQPNGGATGTNTQPGTTSSNTSGHPPATGTNTQPGTTSSNTSGQPPASSTNTQPSTPSSNASGTAPASSTPASGNKPDPADKKNPHKELEKFLAEQIAALDQKIAASKDPSKERDDLLEEKKELEETQKGVKDLDVDTAKDLEKQVQNNWKGVAKAAAGKGGLLGIVIAAIIAAVKNGNAKKAFQTQQDAPKSLQQCKENVSKAEDAFHKAEDASNFAAASARKAEAEVGRAQKAVTDLKNNGVKPTDPKMVQAKSELEASKRCAKSARKQADTAEDHVNKADDHLKAAQQHSKAAHKAASTGNWKGVKSSAAATATASNKAEAEQKKAENNQNTADDQAARGVKHADTADSSANGARQQQAAYTDMLNDHKKLVVSANNAANNAEDIARQSIRDNGANHPTTAQLCDKASEARSYATQAANSYRQLEKVIQSGSIKNSDIAQHTQDIHVAANAASQASTESVVISNSTSQPATPGQKGQLAPSSTVTDRDNQVISSRAQTTTPNHSRGMSYGGDDDD